MRDVDIWTPILMLTAKDGELDETEALDTGADDYLTKPFSHLVLVPHLRALMRRGARERPAVLTAGDLRVDPSSRRCWRGDTEVALTARELSVLEFLVRHAGQVVSKRDIVGCRWRVTDAAGSAPSGSARPPAPRSSSASRSLSARARSSSSCGQPGRQHRHRSPAPRRGCRGPPRSGDHARCARRRRRGGVTGPSPRRRRSRRGGQRQHRGGGAHRGSSTGIVPHAGAAAHRRRRRRLPAGRGCRRRPGIPTADRTRVLERFTRLDDARARRSGGYGLGLAIVRDVVAAHGGTVVIDDGPGGGARVTVELPAAIPA